MFKVKNTKRNVAFLGGVIPSSVWWVVEVQLDGAEEVFAVCESKAKADLMAKLLNSVATVAVA